MWALLGNVPDNEEQMLRLQSFWFEKSIQMYLVPLKLVVR